MKKITEAIGGVDVSFNAVWNFNTLRYTPE